MGTRGEELSPLDLPLVVVILAPGARARHSQQQVCIALAFPLSILSCKTCMAIKMTLESTHWKEEAPCAMREGFEH